MPEAYIYDWVRTPRGKASPKGGLHGVPPSGLLGALQTALVQRGLDPGQVDDLIIGVASQVDEQGADLARTAALLAGWDTPGVTLNRFCASGIDAVATAAARLRAADVGTVVAGGVESVSRVPIFSDRGDLWRDPATVERIGSVHMGIAADLNATIEGFTREQLDAYAVETHTKADAAWEAGVFASSVVPVADLHRDELIRPGLTMQSLAELPPAFAELGESGQDALVLAKHPEVGAIDHLHTVGTSPQMADAAALMVMGSDASGPVRGRIVAAATCATDPVIMLTAGQQAVEEVIAKAGLCPADIDVFEFAEAFSALCLRFRRDLDAGPDRMNPHGGTMAAGHAFGATGAIMVGGCLDELERRDAQYGVAAVSGAAGLGVAVLIERLT